MKDQKKPESKAVESPLPLRPPSARQRLLMQFTAARNRSTPFIFIATPDPATLISSIQSHLASIKQPAPLVQWDISRGLTEVDEQDPYSASAFSAFPREVGIGNPVEILEMARFRLTEDGVLFLHNFHPFLQDSPSCIQAFWNLRDVFKGNGRTLVALAPSWKLPPELSHDALVLDEPFPNAEEIGVLIDQNYLNARQEVRGLPALTPEVRASAIDATVGLTYFAAEQVVSLSLRSTGIDVEALWERKRQLIEATPGLSVYRGRETFADVAGNENVKTFLQRFLKARALSDDPIRLILWLDEIEKMFAGLGHGGGLGDSNGIQADKLQQLLTWMEEHKVPASLFVGFPGTGKSMVAKATGAEAGVPTVQADLGAMSGSLVGQSEALIRGFLKTVDALAPAENGKSGVLLIATCNNVDALPPEFLSRFRRGQFFFDLPNTTEREAMWRLHLVRHGLCDPESKETFRPYVKDVDWTGREIESCCGLAAELDTSLAEAAQYVVPVARTMGPAVHALRESAQNRFLSASYSGPYLIEGPPKPSPVGDVGTLNGTYLNGSHRPRRLNLDNESSS